MDELKKSLDEVSQCTIAEYVLCEREWIGICTGEESHNVPHLTHYDCHR